jgi:N12 class adenine-specific DNA methylase
LSPAEDFSGVKEFGFALRRDGSIWRKESNLLTKLESISAKRGDRIRGLLRIRDAARAYLEAQLNGKEESECCRVSLNQAYDRFTAQHGAINLRANQLALSGDPDLPFLMALEDFDATTEKATKAPFFSQRTLDARKEITRADTSADALIYSLHEKGRVDLEYMTQLTGKPTQSLVDELAGRIFHNPEANRWETTDEYLSGEVVHKLSVVTKLRRPDLALNVAALQAAQPQPLGPGEIRIKLGAPWIPTDLIRQFTEELLSR